MPVEPGAKERFYGNERGYALRLGIGRVQVGEGTMTWDELKRISIKSEREREYALRLASIQEFGILEASLTPFDDRAQLARADGRAGAAAAQHPRPG